MQASFVLARAVSSGFGTGFSPKAPGTVASAVAAAVWFACWYAPNHALSTAGLALLTFAIGMVATRHVIENPGWREASLARESHKGHLDPREVVIDEWAGMFAALVPASGSLFDVACAFFLFRAFDILKPGPVGKAERMPGALGIMLDDLLAGIGAAAVLWGLKLVWSLV